MASRLEIKLKMINVFCQAYFVVFLFLTVVVLFKVILPAVSDGDNTSLFHLKVVTSVIVFNVTGNYLCIWYKSHLSVVKPRNSKFLDHSHSSTDKISWTHDSMTHSSTADKSLVSYGTRHAPIRYSDSHTSHICSDSAVVIDKDYNNYFTYSNVHLADPKLEVERISSNNNNECKISSGFTYSRVIDFSMGGLGDETHLTQDSSVIKADWSKCKDCNVIVPPRVKHCPLCGHCVLKRDHHCFFVGCCVGFHNQRFFTIFCLYAGAGLTYSCVVTLLYLRNYFEATQTWGCLGYLFPVTLVIWLTGETSGFFVCMVLFLYWSMLTALICWHYFSVQVLLVYRGQTNYEWLKGKTTYAGTLWKNIISVFGRHWWVGFIIPAPFMGYVSNGEDWTELISDRKIF